MAQNNPALYASSFSNSRSPPSTFHPISLRLSLHRALTQDLSNYFHERNQIESTYIQSLQSLSSRLHGSKSSSSKSNDLVFAELNQIPLDQRQQDLQMGQQLAEVRRQLEQELAELSRIHDLWKRKVVEQVEKPLRDSLDKSDWQRWGQVERQLGDDVTEYESLVDKLSKVNPSLLFCLFSRLSPWLNPLLSSRHKRKRLNHLNPLRHLNFYQPNPRSQLSVHPSRLPSLLS